MAEHGYEWIEFTVGNGVATITFNAPQFGNALGLKGLQEFIDALYKAEAREDVGAVVFDRTGQGLLLRVQSERGAGERSRCRDDCWALSRSCNVVASDFLFAHAYAEANSCGSQRRRRRLRTGNDALFRYGCMQGYCELLPSMAHDRDRQRCDHQLFSAKIVGFRRAMEWMITNRTVHAQEALEWNVVNRVYDEANFEKNVGIIARELAAGPTDLQGIAKAGFHMGLATIDLGSDGIRDPERDENGPASALPENLVEVPVRRTKEQ